MVGKTRTFAAGVSHQQQGDPVKLARALVELVNAANPPLRLPLGKDTLERIKAKNAYVEQEVSTWRKLAESIAIDS